MTSAIYRTWLFPVHRIRNAAVLAAYRGKCTKRTHKRRVPTQGALIT